MNNYEQELHLVRGKCPIHDAYEYRVREGEGAFGCPVCAVNKEEECLNQLIKKQQQVRCRVCNELEANCRCFVKPDSFII